MHSYPLTFLITAVIAGIGGLSAAAGGIAKILFALSLALFVISFFLGRRIPPV